MICAIILDVCPSWSPRNVSTPTETSIFGIILPQMSPLPILQWYHTENDLQKYPTAHNRPHRYVLLHLNCIEFKSLYLLNRSVVHDKIFIPGDIKGSIILEQIWETWSDVNRSFALSKIILVPLYLLYEYV